MATIYGSSSKNGYGFYVVLTDAEVGTSSQNTSKINYELYIKNGDVRFNGSNYVVNMTINGTNYGSTMTINTTTVGYNQPCLILSGTTSAIAHNTDGSKTVNVSATVSRNSYSSYDGGYMSLSGTFTMQTIARYFSQTPVLTYTSATETSASFSWSTSETCSKVVLYYKLPSASSYTTGPTIYNNSTGATSGTGSITGLAAGTTYNLYAVCTRKDSALNSDSNILTPATYAYPYIKSIGTTQITLPVPTTTSVNQSIVLENPLNRTNVTVYAKKDSISGTQFGSVANSSSALTNLTLSMNTSTMYSSIPNSTNGNVVYYCVYNDGTNNHTSATTAGTFITTAANCGPTVSANPTYANTTRAHASLVGADTIIQGKSSFSVTSPAVTARGRASVSKYYFKIGNGNYESATSATKAYTSTSLSGTIAITTYAEDSRGYTSAEKTTNMRVLAYNTPSANVSVTRNSYSTNATITVISATRSVLSKSSATSTDVNNWRGNTSSNKISLAISPTGPTLAASVIGGTAATISNASVSVTNVALTSAYTVTVNISDRITTKSLTFTLDKATPIMSLLNTNRVGVNKVDPTCELDVNGEIKSSGDILTSTNVKVNNVPLVSFASIGSQNKNNYPWHRIATVTVGTGTYQDKDCILDIRHKYDKGGYGRIKISIRTSAKNAACSASANWLYRYNINGQSIGIGVWGVSGDNVYADIYYKAPGAYARASVRQVDESKLYTLITSSEATDTTTTDKKTSVECYKDIETAATELRDQDYSFITYSITNDILQCYPIGSVYISVNNTNPGTLFGGTWEAFAQGKTLIGVDTSQTEFNTVKKTGGSKSNSYTPEGSVNNHTLTLDEIPAHNHGAIAGYFGNGTFSKSFNWLNTNTGNYIQYETLPSSGGGGAHNHGWTGTSANISTLQPYITVYFWLRTA